MTRIEMRHFCICVCACRCVYSHVGVASSSLSVEKVSKMESYTTLVVLNKLLNSNKEKLGWTIEHENLVNRIHIYSLRYQSSVTHVQIWRKWPPKVGRWYISEQFWVHLRRTIRSWLYLRKTFKGRKLYLYSLSVYI